MLVDGRTEKDGTNFGGTPASTGHKVRRSKEISLTASGVKLMCVERGLEKVPSVDEADAVSEAAFHWAKCLAA